ncbi:MAG: hypothetical protein ACRD2P_08695, partial [Terriglobia bacterium]
PWVEPTEREPRSFLRNPGGFFVAAARGRRYSDFPAFSHGPFRAGGHLPFRDRGFYPRLFLLLPFGEQEPSARRSLNAGNPAAGTPPLQWRMSLQFIVSKERVGRHG